MAADEVLARDLSELGLESLSFLHSPARLIVADSDNRILGFSNSARRFLFPKAPISEPISKLATGLRDLPLSLADKDAQRWINLEQVLANVREELKAGDNSHNSVDASTSLAHPVADIPVRIESSIIRTSSGRLYSSLCLTPSDLDAEGERSKPTTTVVPKLMHMKDKILDHMHELVIFCLSIDGNLLVTNKAAEALLGDSTPVVGRGIEWLKERWKVYEPDFSAEIPFEKWGIYTLLTKGEIVRQTIGYYDPAGLPRIIELGGEPIKDDDGKLVAGIVWLKDETRWSVQSEEKFRRICNSIPQMMFGFTPYPSLKPEYFNKKWYEYTGLTPEASKSGANPFWTICHPEDRAALENEWKQSAIEKDRPVQAQFRCKNSEGEYRWMLCRANCYVDEQGQNSKWYGTLTDINDHVDAVEQQNQLRDQLSQILHHSQLAAMIIQNTPDRQISSLHGKRIFPVGNELAVGSNFLEVFKEFDEFTKPLERILNNKKDFVGPDITIELNMKGRWFRCRYTPAEPRSLPPAGRADSISPNKAGPVEAVVLVAADFTAKYQSEQALELSAEEKNRLQARESAAMLESQFKSTVLANASHEIRTPIAQIIGMSDFLLDEKEAKLDATTRSYAYNINRSANHLKAIISDILDLSKIEAGKMLIANTPFDLGTLLSDIIEMFKITTRQKGLNFEYMSILDTRDQLVIGDQGRVRQVLTNLMGNAFKFTSEGFIRMTTMPDFHESDPNAVRQSDPSIVKIRFVVEDSGVGISDEALKKIFIPFTQADQTTSLRFGGTGLGLSISKELVELMHGEIALERSQRGSGCTAWFTIPFQRYSGTKIDEPDQGNLDTMGRFRFEMERAMERHDEENSSVGSISPAPSPRTAAAQLYPSPLPETTSLGNRTDPSSTLMPPPNPPAASTSRSSSRAPARILLVDDDTVMRAVVTKHLNGFGCTVYTAVNGQAGLELLERTLQRGDFPDLILTDCRMPVMDGYQFATRVRQHPNASVRSLPIIAMSAATTPEEKQYCEQVGMSHFLSKPAKKEELHAVLLAYLPNQRRSRGSNSATRI